MGRSSNIQLDKAQEFLVRSQSIKDEINLLNAEMCEMMGWDYRPPRGFTNPLGEIEEKGKVKKGTAAKIPAMEKVAEAGVTTG
ncbi:MAG: hypothetical protein PHF56_14945 [Desulfuromonadaceae bacterium]|nr:hypothetical protein [Desulfuromonadaceae bacterium]